MARDISNGYLLLTERTLARLGAGQIDTVALELEKLLREVRSQQPDLQDIEALRLRNRKIQRLSGARLVVQAFRSKRRR